LVGGQRHRKPSHSFLGEGLRMVRPPLLKGCHVVRMLNGAPMKRALISQFIELSSPWKMRFVISRQAATTY